MFYADTLGLATVLERLHGLAREHGARYWEPAKLLARLAGEDTTFAAWQAARAAG
jgi:hypothetical protein